MAQVALRWILMFDAVSCAIPGAKNDAQARANAAAADLPPLEPAAMDGVQKVYDDFIREHVHGSW
jgi:aryl-alcohol dehydrogenase-like predicted oxidoreductase